MDYVLLIIAFIVLIAGFLGCILPVLPGPPLSFSAILIVQFTRFADFSPGQLIFLGALAIIVQALDYVMPAWGTKKFGGTRTGTWGSITGLIAGMLFLPALGPLSLFTILAGPFLGALIGEKIAGQESDKALRAAFGTFIGFLAGTIMKLATAIIISVYFFREIWVNVF